MEDSQQPGQITPTLARLRLDVSYDGTGFSGWAVQPDRRTVAGVVSDALSAMFGEGGPVGLTVAGRTDAGVHATGQVCHVDVPEATLTALAETLVRRLSGLLPTDVRVLRAIRVPPTFDARFCALYRRYEYLVTDEAFGAQPLRRYEVLTWPRKLNLEAMNAASAPLCGEHDFTAFCRRREHASTIRTMSRFDWHRRSDEVIVATVEADAFCQAMVRSLVGALLAVGEGRRSVDWPASLLPRTERACEVMVAPPHGLTLVKVEYPADEAGYSTRTLVTRRRRDTLV